MLSILLYKSGKLSCYRYQSQKGVSQQKQQNLKKAFFFFLREFQPMTSAPDDSSLLSD